jgi:geranylgeranyl diphosphate synthase type I
MTLDSSISEIRPRLADHIRGIVNDARGQHESVSFYAETLDRIADLCLGGKLLRGVFVPMTYRFFRSEDPPQAVWDAAAAMEFMQTALLIHDDIIDADDTRRGMRTIHAQYREDARQRDITEARRYGENMAICVGDVAIFLAFQILGSALAGNPRGGEMLSRIAHEYHLVAIGEMIDVDFAMAPVEPTKERILDMYRYKTARYSFSLPFALGALLGGADTKTVGDLERLGETIGILFQIRDDQLGLTGDGVSTGKPVGADIRENKKTLHRSILYGAATPSERSFLDACFGSAELKTDDILAIMELMRSHHVEEAVRSFVDDLHSSAVRDIDALAVSKEARITLHAVLELVTSRDR